MLINARPRHTLCRLHKYKCLPARAGGLIKDIHISSTGMCEHFRPFVMGGMTKNIYPDIFENDIGFMVYNGILNFFHDGIEMAVLPLSFFLLFFMD